VRSEPGVYGNEGSLFCMNYGVRGEGGVRVRVTCCKYGYRLSTVSVQKRRKISKES
jgi:hypothetical protein